MLAGLAKQGVVDMLTGREEQGVAKPCGEAMFRFSMPLSDIQEIKGEGGMLAGLVTQGVGDMRTGREE